jgi:hypothetical protein
MTTPNIIPLSRAVLCMDCMTVNDSTSEVCVACGETGGLLNLGRVLNPTPELGAVTFLLREASC